MKSNRIIKKFGDYKFVAEKREQSHYGVSVFHGESSVLDAQLICCEKHVEAMLVEFAKKYLTVAIARFKKDRKELKLLLARAKVAMKEAKV